MHITSALSGTAVLNRLPDANCSYLEKPLKWFQITTWKDGTQ